MENLVPVEFKEQRIMTTEVLAESYGTDKKIISNNFNRNIERFEEGRHFYKLEGDELKTFKGIHQNDESLKYVSVLYLWTEKGAARHAKILDTDEAWKVYEKLEDTYFRVKEQRLNINELSPELQMFQRIFNQVAKSQLEQKRLSEELSKTKEQTDAVNKKAQLLEQRVNNLDAVNLDGNARQRLNSIVKKFAFDKGITVPSAWHEFRRAFNIAFKTNIEQRKTNYQGKLGNRSLSYPEYLEKVGLIEDALRIADKMANSTVRD